MAVIGGEYTSTATFSGTMTEATATFNQTNSISNRYFYVGYWGPSGSYVGTNKYTSDPDGRTKQFIIYWKYNKTTLGTLNGSLKDGTTVPAHGPFVSFTVSDVQVSENLSDGSSIQFILWTSIYSYDNTWDALATATDTTLYAFTVNVANPPYQVFNYPIYFYDGSTLINTYTQYIRSRDFEYTYFPNNTSKSNYQNADSMFPDSIVKPGYRSLGWDTSSSATNVVYGGRNVSSLNIPSGVIRYDSGLNLYSVWEKLESLFIYVNGERRAVTRMDVVTSVNTNNNTMTTHAVRNGKIYDGNSWKEFSL